MNTSSNYKFKAYFILTFVFIIPHFSIFSQSKKNPAGFIENRGQIIDQYDNVNNEVKFLLNLPGQNIQLHSNGLSYDNYIFSEGKNDEESSIHFHRVDIELIGAKTLPEVLKTNQSTYYYNYYTTGTQESGVLNVKSYESVIYKNIYDGIDIEFTVFKTPTKTTKFKYNFIINPGADPNQIRLRYNGMSNIYLNEGKIVTELAHGLMYEQIPLSFIKETKKELNVGFKQMNENTFIFDIPVYDRSKTLIIDPEPILDWCTYLGGSNEEMGYRVFQTIMDEIYVTGKTMSANNIATTGAHQVTLSGSSSDAFLTKFDEDGNILWSTYYGGNGTEWGYALALNSSDDIFLLGETSSTSNIATTGAHQTTYGGGTYDAFLAKFTPNGIRQWATYLGGNGWDFGESIAISNCDDIYITGQTASSNAITTPGAHQTTFGGGGYDAYLARFNPSGVLLWATYFGGSSVDRGYGLAISQTNDIFLTGHTASSSNIATSGAHQTSIGGSFDGFLSKFDTLGNLLWATYFGSTAEDWFISVQVSDNNNIYLSGLTKSSSNISTTGAHQSVYGGNQDAILVKFNPAGQLQWATYYGGSNVEIGFQVKISNLEYIYLVGETKSTNNISTPNAYQQSLGGGYDAFLTKFDCNGNRIWGTYFGGSSDDNGRGMHLGKTGNICITGYTKSNSNISTSGVHQQVYGGVQDAFVAKFRDITTHIEMFDENNFDNIFVPNIFSPNDDGQNDQLFVYSTEIKNMTLSIYNRWGQKVFETNAQQTGWQGTNKGEKAPAGVYVYHLEAELFNGTKINKKGNITLVR